MIIQPFDIALKLFRSFVRFNQIIIWREIDP